MAHYSENSAPDGRFDIRRDALASPSDADDDSHDVEKALLSQDEESAEEREDSRSNLRRSRFADALDGVASRLPPRMRQYLDRRRRPAKTSQPAEPASRRGFCAISRLIFNYPEPGLKLRKTAWLDALRGVAAFNVFIYHYAEYWVEKEASWTDGPGNNPHMWWAAPFIRSWYDAGNAAVCLFFAISGYVLTGRILGLIRQRRSEEVLGALSSAVLRRGIRLYMPVIIITFLLMNWGYWSGWPLASDIELQKSWWLELAKWYEALTRLWMPLRYPDRWDEILNPYDGNISWTIPLEYYGSITVYMALLFTSRITKFSVRVALFAVLIYMYTVKDEWYVVQFLLGAIYAEYQLVRDERAQKLEGTGRSNSRRWRARLFKTYMIFNLIFGIYLSGMPGKRVLNPDHRTKLPSPRPFFDWMSGWVPIEWYEKRQVDRYFWSAGANCILVAFGELPALRRTMDLRPFQYLGKLSFGLYLCHIFIRGALRPLDAFYLNLVGLDGTIPVIGHHASARFAVAYFLRMIVATPINLFVAGLFERFVDRPSVSMGRRFEKIVLRIGGGDDTSSSSRKGGELPSAIVQDAVEEIPVHAAERLPLNRE